MDRNIGIALACLLLLITLSGITVLGQPEDRPVPDATRTPCSDCHVCQTPTRSEPCLSKCLRTGVTSTPAHSATEGPDMAMLDELEQLYGPVRFDHKHHAEMVGMGEGCSICHHYSPAGKFPPCAECHGEEPAGPPNLRQPGLKGAFHRQCMGCHREWSHDTKCVVCHLPHEGSAFSAAPHDSTDIVGIPHPEITVPDVKVWVTPHEEAPTVTLHHQDHIDLYGLRCVDCHQQENCSYCHDLDKELRLGKTDEEIHAICNDCHLNDPCGKCHDTGQKPGFSHASVGWPLNKYHEKLGCRSCHPTGRKIARLNRECAACHGGWNQANFNHVRVGLQLDEIHVELECTDCHPGKAFDKMPDCSGCHDDGRTHEDAPPGEYVRSLSLH
ncbi:MAG: cytochrome c3 family protein [Candidatus Zixiibacteriota bacterium]|nr:MAG: cytochrome c3 family protein [candidate division Zixibacteria bacterium]